jgi:hypothetical protein
MLNYGALVTTFGELLRSNYEPEKLLFVRPDDDGKSFAGEVLRFAECQEWLGRLKAIEHSNLSGESRIIVGEPFHIGKEWRLWCVDGKVIAASQYRNNFKPEKRRGCPDEVVTFVEASCKEFYPS